MHAQRMHKMIENEFSHFYRSDDQLYWNHNDDSAQYVPVKTPLRLADKWDKIVEPYQQGHAVMKYPFTFDKGFECVYHLVEDRLLLTNVYATTYDDNEIDKIVHRLDSLLPEKFTHEYDESLKAHHISVSPKGAIPITWGDSLEVRNFQTYNRPGETSDEFLNRLDVHPYLRLYFKEGILTNIKFITPKMKKE